MSDLERVGAWGVQAAGPRARMALAAWMALGACGGGAAPQGGTASTPRIVQPGAPGQATRTVRASDVVATRANGYSEADVAFVQGMIPHHVQALVMTGLVRERASSEALRSMALRMEISQQDEIVAMERWLRERGEAVPDARAAEHMMMPGMLTHDQMQRLASAEGSAFDRLFLELMVQHHEGALMMVERLFATAGAAEEIQIRELATDVDIDQRVEISRMRGILEGDSR